MRSLLNVPDHRHACSHSSLASSLSNCPQLAGAAKFPYLSLESSALDFGGVAVGRAASLQLRLANLSPVPARFAVTLEDAAAAAGLPLEVLGEGGGGGGCESVLAVTPAE